MLTEPLWAPLMVTPPEPPLAQTWQVPLKLTLASTAALPTVTVEPLMLTSVRAMFLAVMSTGCMVVGGMPAMIDEFWMMIPPLTWLAAMLTAPEAAVPDETSEAFWMR